MLNLRLKSDDKNMAHEELVLRFFAYHDSEYKRVKNLSYFLTDYMKNNQNPGSDKISELRNLFVDTIKLVNKYLGDKAFSNFGENTNKWASLSNRSLYDPEFKRSLHSQAGGKMIEKRVSGIKKIISNTGL
jgi:hypothetical protein